MAQQNFVWGTGRRKSSTARVRVRPGTGEILVNTKPYKVFFPDLGHQSEVEAPLNATETRNAYDIFINVKGGGITGQSGACALGIARAIHADRPDTDETLRAGSFLTRDGRMKERKKYGQRGARRGFQFSKR